MKPLPHSLRGNEAQGWIHGHTVAQYQIGEFRNLIYVLNDEKLKESWIIDPQSEFSWEKDVISGGSKVTGVLLTHSHFDHIAGVESILERFPLARLYVHPAEVHRLNPRVQTEFASRMVPLHDGDHLSLGSLSIEVLHTPGHSAGGCCYLFEAHFGPKHEPEREWVLLTGDTLFIRDCGRTDLPTGNVEEMFRSLQRIRSLGVDPIILPGHQYTPELASRLSHERDTNPALRCASVEELHQLN